MMVLENESNPLVAESCLLVFVQLIGVLATDTNRPAGRCIKDAEDLLQAPIFWKLPNDYRLSAASLTKGVPVAMEEPGSKLARSYSDLAKKLSGSTSSGGYPRVEAGRGGSRFRKLFGSDKGVRNVS